MNQLSPAEKAARKKARKAAKSRPPPKVPVSALRELALFNGVSTRILDQIEARSEAEIINRDVFIAGSDQGQSTDNLFFHFVISGQVGLGEMTEQAGKASKAKAKAEIFKKVGQTYGVLTEGDFFSDNFASANGGLCLYTITEVHAVRIRQDALDDILQKNPSLKDRFKKHTEKWFHRIHYLRQNSGRDEILDFYVKNGFSFSTRTKIRQLEICIDCDKCVVGCEERHGVARLERFGPQVGLINFSISCRQCYDPRCLIDCNFDAIARDPISQEIRVSMADCTGCSVCARACPNDSIFIYGVTDDMDTSIWEKAGKKVPKKIATKCDRCAGYDDMACVAACPTGSMIDATPEDIFNISVDKSVNENCSTQPFEMGWTENKAIRKLPKILYSLAGLLIFICISEWVSRRWFGDTLILPFFTEEVLGKRLGEGYTSFRGLGYWFGIIGALCMCATLLYVIRNRFETKTQAFGSKYFWFSLHNALGVLGPALVFLHGNLHFAKWPTVGVWASILVVLSGFLGQYLANQLPGIEYKTQRDLQDLDRAINQLSEGWGEHTRSVNVAELVKLRNMELDASRAENMGTFRFLAHLVLDDLTRFIRIAKLRFGELQKVKNKALRKQTIQLFRERLLVDRQKRFYKTAGRLVAQWRLFHIFFSIGLFLLMALHVAVVLLF